MSNVLILNGPNLNLLGTREPGTYGSQTLADVIEMCRKAGADLGLSVSDFQSNHEGALIDKIHECGAAGTAIVFNPGGYSHTSVAIRDAISSAKAVVVEVHISNIHAREEFRHHSFVTPVAKGVIAGLGTQGYVLALHAIANMTNKN